MFKPKLGVRGRILAIALVPSIALLGAGLGGASILVVQGLQAGTWSSQLTQAQDAGLLYASTLQEERRLTLLSLAGDQQATQALAAQRKRTDSGLAGLAGIGSSFNAFGNQSVEQSAAQRQQLGEQITTLRRQIDAKTVSGTDAYAFFNQLLDALPVGMQAIGRTAPDAEISSANTVGETMIRVVEALSRSIAVGGAAVTSGTMDPARLQEFTNQVGSYHTLMTGVVTGLEPTERQLYQQLMATPAWTGLSKMESAITQRGTQTSSRFAALPLTAAEYQTAGAEVNQSLQKILTGAADHTNALAADYGERTARNSLLGGAGVLALTIAAFLVALRLSNRVIRRLKRLRGETLALADEQLPQIMDRLRAGEPVDLETEVAQLDYGTDEIGQVADAFNRAQHAAVAAAVTEAKTRDGVNAVFLNIAHRSQVVVHRQLEILDKAEYKQEDPEQLELLFQLDHLATRERRNAENLIILGGEQPGRQWRNPVPLLEIVRSAVAETEDYARVRTTRLPDLAIVGSVVADLIHLLAELVDNATSFSPPESRVEVSGNVVGKGVVVEITDQGLGMSEQDMARANETLREAPDFSVSTLSSDSRLGIFVVAQLAARTGANVRLVESDYGGVRAIVLVPTNLIADDATNAEPVPKRRARIPVAAGENHAPPPPPPPAPEPAPVAWPANNGTPPAERDDRPVLPRRRRQASIAPQLARPAREPTREPSPRRPQAAEQARDLLSAIENGTRQGRRTRPDQPPAAAPDEREGNGGHHLREP
ncbi:HAMP domain-containing protein [Amycolatopsis acidicola]|uniref:histidine kinase n=1 Tax=Amycolatopsis acidicola TaxID=2596893 RepID=A0A5N0V4H8_9PSEU|nr:nitrate- and nitrite sensing domain-containing protein [Amycolatopsis acidicola]KAA9161327.1 HAMP domain-containing protein [Amycolatopsis acidicola]